jgi:hypothetical protein
VGATAWAGATAARLLPDRVLAALVNRGG